MDLNNISMVAIIQSEASVNRLPEKEKIFPDNLIQKIKQPCSKL